MVVVLVICAPSISLFSKLKVLLAIKEITLNCIEIKFTSEHGLVRCLRAQGDSDLSVTG